MYTEFMQMSVYMHPQCQHLLLSIFSLGFGQYGSNIDNFFPILYLHQQFEMIKSDNFLYAYCIKDIHKIYIMLH